MRSNMNRKKKRRVVARRKRTIDCNLDIDYKDTDLLKRFITDRGKIIPRRISGATQAQQRKISVAVKRARYLALIPASIAHETERGHAGEMQAITQTYLASMRVRPVREQREGSRPPRSEAEAPAAPADNSN